MKNLSFTFFAITIMVLSFSAIAINTASIASAYDGGGGDGGCCGGGDGGTTDGGGGGGGSDSGGSDPVPPVCNISLSATTIDVGGQFTLTWNGAPSDATFQINNTPVADSGSANYTFPAGLSSIRYVMTGQNGTASCIQEVVIRRTTPPTPPTCDITANVSAAIVGGQYTITWAGTPTNGIFKINGAGVAATGNATYTFVGPNTETFTFTGETAGGTCSDQVTISRINPVLPVCTLTANPTSIVNGGSSVLSWTTTNASSTSINQGIGVVTGTSRSVSPATTTTYTMTVTNPNGSATCAATVTVVPPVPQAPRCDNFDAAPLTINRGQSSVLSWNTTNATAAMISGGVGAVAVDGSTTVSPLESTTYTLNLTGTNNQTFSCTRRIEVIQPEQPTVPRCDNFDASASTITRGSSVTLSWNTTNASSVVINPGVGSVAVDGSTSVSPSDTTTYTLTATGVNNQTTTCTRTITVETSGGGGGGGSSSPKCTLRISDTKINRGDRITLKWDTSRATEVTLKDSHGKTIVTTEGKKSADKKDLYDGEITIRPEKDTTYTLLAERGSKDRTCRVSVDVSGGVTVLETRDQNPVVTGIALTQVPYTGFEAGPFLTMVFFAILLLWALYLAYVLVVRKNQLTPAAAIATPVATTAPVTTPVVASTLATPRFVAPVATPVADTPVVGYASAVATTDVAYEATAEAIETAAHAERILISSEAMRHFIAVTTNDNRTDTLALILAKAKASYPSEDGWVVLNIDRMKSVMAAVAPAVSVFTPRTITE